MAEGEDRSSGAGVDKKPYQVGFRFKPTDEELVEYYLLPKLQGKPSVRNDAIIEADVYECDPEILINQKYKDRGENRWYFLSPRTRKYPGGTRPSRRTADDRGRWKPSTGKSAPKKGKSEREQEEEEDEEYGKEEKLCSNGAVKYCENTLAYHVGPAKDEKKTKWLMHELTVPEYEIKLDPSRPSANTMLLDRYAMCTIYKSPLTKWIKQEEEETRAALEAAAAPSSMAAGPAPESGQVTSAPSALSSKRAGKRPAVDQQPIGHATSPKRARRPALPRGPPAPAHDNGGGGRRMRGAVPLGVGAAGYYSVPGHHVQMPWPPATGNRLQGPVQLPQAMHRQQVAAAPYSAQAPPLGQQPGPSLRQPPPHAAHNSRGRTMTMMPRAPSVFDENMMMCPQNGTNLAAGQTVPPPSAVPQPPPQQLPKVVERDMNDPYTQRVVMQLLAEMRAQEEARRLSASHAAQQQSPTASNLPPPPQQQQPSFDAGSGDHPARANATFPHHHVPVPRHNCYPRGGGQLQQQRSSVNPEMSVPGSAAAPASGFDNVSIKYSVCADANEGSSKGSLDNNGDQVFADLATMMN